MGTLGPHRPPDPVFAGRGVRDVLAMRYETPEFQHRVDTLLRVMGGSWSALTPEGQYNLDCHTRRLAADGRGP